MGTTDMTKITDSSRFRLEADVRFRVVADEGVVVRQSEGEVLVVNELGGEILTHIQQDHSFGDIVSALTGRYDADSSEITRHTSDFLDEMLSGKVIEILAD